MKILGIIFSIIVAVNFSTLDAAVVPGRATIGFVGKVRGEGDSTNPANCYVVMARFAQFLIGQPSETGRNGAITLVDADFLNLSLWNAVTDNLNKDYRDIRISRGIIGPRWQIWGRDVFTGKNRMVGRRLELDVKTASSSEPGQFSLENYRYTRFSADESLPEPIVTRILGPVTFTTSEAEHERLIKTFKDEYDRSSSR